MKKLLLVANDEVGPQMAGPGIRYFEFARELSKRFDVTLLTPTEPEVELDGVRIKAVARYSTREFVRLAAEHDALVAQTLRPWTMRWLARSDTQVIYDLYDPFLIENLALFTGNESPSAELRMGYRGPHLLQEIALATGNAFICASERQRDLWLGLLAALGRIEPDTYAADPTLRTLIDVVPFGLPAEPPVSDRRALKGVVPGIRESDRVLLWGGGIWNWFDPLTLIRAVHELARRRDDVKLFFLGARRPNPVVPEMKMMNTAVELARELGVFETHVFFNFEWVPYAERTGYLLDADIGVSSHFDNLETRFAFRTRILDYLWAGLPTVTTEGDVLAELVREEKLGRTIGYEDVPGWVDAIEALLDAGEELAEIRANIARVRSTYEWPTVARRLARLAEIDGAPVDDNRRFVPNTLEYLWIGSRSVIARRGLASGVRDLLSALKVSRIP